MKKYLVLIIAMFAFTACNKDIRGKWKLYKYTETFCKMVKGNKLCTKHEEYPQKNIEAEGMAEFLFYKKNGGWLTLKTNLIHHSKQGTIVQNKADFTRETLRKFKKDGKRYLEVTVDGKTTHFIMEVTGKKLKLTQYVQKGKVTVTRRYYFRR